MSDEYYKKESIMFFKSLINFKTLNNKSTRPTNFSGHVGRHMKPDLKKWFLDKYPNSSDYVKFFLENEHIFSYDCITGEVGLNSFVSKFEKPMYLLDIEMCVTDTNTSLSQLSRRVSELEFFLVIFRLFVDSYESNKTIYISVDHLAALFNHSKYGLIKDQIENMISNKIGFDRKIVQYLQLNYETVFLIDEQNNKISLKKSLISLINKVSKEIDDSVFTVFKALVAKYLKCNGGKDINELKEAMSSRHYYIIYYMFGRQQVEEYTLLDFVESYPEQFVCKREVDSEGNVKRTINVKSEQRSQHNDTNANYFAQSQINQIGLRNCQVSDSSQDQIHVYQDENEQVVKEVLLKVVQNDVNNDLVRCCVCDKDVSNVSISYSDYRDWALKHKQCLLFKLIDFLKKECQNKSITFKTNIDKSVQTVSTGNVRSRKSITSNALY